MAYVIEARHNSESRDWTRSDALGELPNRAAMQAAVNDANGSYRWTKFRVIHVAVCIDGCQLLAAPGDVFCEGCREGHESDRP